MNSVPAIVRVRGNAVQNALSFGNYRRREERKAMYGKELILDIHKCDSSKFTRRYIRRYFAALCKIIDMKRADLHWWDDVGVPIKERQTAPHLKGTSAVQFIMTSSIVIHTLDILQAAYINIFSCKEFHIGKAASFSKQYFGGRIARRTVIYRL